MRILVFTVGAILIIASSGWADTLTQQAASYHQDAETALKKGDIDGAITCYQKIIAITRDDALAHNILGVLYEGKNELGRAENEYLAALSLDPKYIDAYFNLARLYEKTNQNDKAAENLEKLVTLLKPQDKRLAEIKNKILELTSPSERKSDIVKKIEKEAADKLSKKVIQEKRLTRKENEKKSQSHFSSGKEYYREKKYPLAVEEFKAALKYDPSNHNVVSYIKLCEEEINKAKKR